MKAITAIVAIVMLLCGALWLVMGPMHTRAGRQNTRYSARFTLDTFRQVQVGMNRSSVTSLLGAPFEGFVRTNYPVWALRDEGCRERYGTNNVIRFEVLSFSQPVRRQKDYDLVDVAIGPEDTVLDKSRFVTD